MNFRIYFVVLSLICTSIFFTSTLKASIEFDVGAGYRQDELNWNIGAGDPWPNVMSELEWRNLKIAEVTAAGKWWFGQGMYVRGDADYGWIFSGDNQDSDYAGSNRTFEFSRSLNSGDGGYVWDLSLGFGKLMCLSSSGLFISPTIGYAASRQHLVMEEGYQVLSEKFGEFKGSRIGPLPGGDWYETLWQGPWMGADIFFAPQKNLMFWGIFEYHRARYKGTGHWSNRSDFYDDFQHSANGNGFVMEGGIRYQLSSTFGFGSKLRGQIWNTEAGRDRTFFIKEIKDSNGTVTGVENAVGECRLNKVEWRSWALTFFLNWVF